MPTEEGERTTPSHVAYRKSGNMFVGRSARMQALANSKNTYYFVKSLIGCRPEGVPEEDIACLSYDVIFVDGALRLRCPVLDRASAAEEMPPQAIRELASDAPENIGEEIKIFVTTAPGYP